MNREGLQRIIQAAAAMLGEDAVVIIGSQSILASFREFILPDDATMSAEADTLPFDDIDESKADKVDGLLGEASHFSEKYGIYADGVSPWTASLPEGWGERLVRIEDPESGAVGLCLHPEDLCVAKALAGRAKDTRFLTAVFREGLVDPEAVARKLTTVALRPSDAAISRRALDFLDNVPRRASYAKGPPIAKDDIARLTEKLARMRDAAVLCGRTNRDGSLCMHDRRHCAEHP
ncbi:MAG: hypothetical protein Q7V57_09935 [Actinomycetota bacterium]|nr:hypothetical protein [Actinomycetota bacterium]